MIRLNIQNNQNIQYEIVAKVFKLPIQKIHTHCFPRL